MPDRPIHGFLLLDKPLGLTSAQAVGSIKRALPKGTKIGHAGTLDPLASGLLPLAIGEATKLISFLFDAPKAYEFSIRWGEKRNTADAEGEVVATSPSRPEPDAIQKVLPKFLGMIQQKPPAYSALKIGGKRAYELARAGEVVELAARAIHIHALELCSATPDEAAFRVRCGKGTYVRSLAEDIAASLGALGYVSALRRTEIGKFSVKNAFLLENPAELRHSAALFEQASKSFLLPAAVLDDIPALEVDEAAAKRIRCGQTLSSSHSQNGLLALFSAGKLLAMAESHQGLLRPVRVFNL